MSDDLTRAIAEALGCDVTMEVEGLYYCSEHGEYLHHAGQCPESERIIAALAPLIKARYVHREQQAFDRGYDKAMEGIGARVRDVEEERDRNKRAAVTLGNIVERQCRDVLDATGMHHVIGEDGDGDWALVWERLAEIGAFIKAIDEPPNEVRRIAPTVEADDD